MSVKYKIYLKEKDTQKIDLMLSKFNSPTLGVPSDGDRTMFFDDKFNEAPARVK